MNILRLIDINTYIYAGNVMRHSFIEGNLYRDGDTWDTERLYTGGLTFLFNVIRDFSRSSTLVFAADRTPSVRMKICPEYKQNRNSSISQEQRREITIQKDIAERMLTDCGFNVVYCEDWESDDVMYTMSRTALSTFDHIYIHTSDSDLNMSVLDKVSIAPVRKNDRPVNIDNYETNAGAKGTITEYNLCNFYKMLDGDVSDNYKGIVHYKLRERLQNAFLNKRMKPYLGDSRCFGEMVKNLIPELYDQYVLAYQQIVPVEYDLLKEMDRDYIDIWGKIVGNNGYVGVDYRNDPSIQKKRKEAKDYLKQYFLH